MKNLLSNFSLDEIGGGVVEYSLILALVAIAAIVGLTSIGSKLTPSFNNIAANVN